MRRTSEIPMRRSIDLSWTMAGRMLMIVIQEHGGKTTIMLMLTKL